MIGLKNKFLLEKGIEFKDEDEFKDCI